MINLKILNQTKTISINDFSKINNGNNVQDEIAAVRIYNFNTSKKTLKRGMGVRHYTTHAENEVGSFEYVPNYQALNLEYINKVMYFKQYFSASGNTKHRLLVHGSDGKLYLFEMFSFTNTLNWAYSLEFSDIPIVLDYKKDGLDSILISANDKLVVWSTGRTPYEVSNVPTITSMCVFNDVLYCTIAGETDKIWYTENLDPESVGTESDNTKYLTLTGQAGGGVKIVEFKENVYVFRDYGISRLNTYAKSGPTTNQIYLSHSKIYANTVSVCGDCVIFLTRDGLYKFNGVSVAKIDSLQNQLVDSFNEYAVATTLQDNYYLALKLNFNDDTLVGCEQYAPNQMKNNSLIKLDLNNYSFEILRGVDVKDMLPLKAGVEEKLLLTFNSYYQDYIGELTNDSICFDGVLPSVYCSNDIITNEAKPILIRKIIIDASSAVKVVVIVGNKKYPFNTSLDGLNEFLTSISCTKFKIEISTQVENAYINFVKIEYNTQK